MAPKVDCIAVLFGAPGVLAERKVAVVCYAVVVWVWEHLARDAKIDINVAVWSMVWDAYYGLVWDAYCVWLDRECVCSVVGASWVTTISTSHGKPL